MRRALLALLLLALLAPGAAGSFGLNHRVSSANPSGFRGNPTIAAGSQGVFAAWQQANAAGGHDVVVAASFDGASWSAPVVVDDMTNDSFQENPDLVIQGRRLYLVWTDFRTGFDDGDLFFDTSEGGVAWGTDRLVADEVGGVLQDHPSIAVAPNGSLYVAYAVGGSAETTEIRLVASYDGGLTWSPSVAVSGVHPESRFSPRAAVAPNGTVYVVWADARSGTYLPPGGGPALWDYDVYMARSTDGGRTFLPEGIVGTPVAQRGQSLPDLAVDRNGTVYVAWQDARANPYDLPDIFFAKSLDGVTFIGETTVNDTSPVVDNPRRTTHQTPSIVWDNETDDLFVAWVDDRSDLLGNLNHNVYVARSQDGGATWRPFQTGAQGATHFFDDAATHNGVHDTAEATISSADDRLQPGVLDGLVSPDRVVASGRASLRVDLTGEALRYDDADADSSYSTGEGILLDSRTVLFPLIEPTAFLEPPTDLVPPDHTLSLLRRVDSNATTDRAIDVEPGKTLALTNWSTPSAASEDNSVIGLASADPVSSSVLFVSYRTPAGFSGGTPMSGSTGGNPGVMLFTPVSTTDAYVSTSFDLFAAGFDTVDELRFLNVTFTNGGSGNVSFDALTFNVTRGRAGAVDSYDVLLTGTAPTAGSPLVALAASDRVVYMDTDSDGAYDAPEPLLRSPTAAAEGMDLTSSFELLPPAAEWRVFLNPFPINDDRTAGGQFTPRLAVSPSGHLVAVWQDYRNGGYADIQSASAQIFTPIVVPDTTPPSITHTPPGPNLQTGSTFNITAVVTDDTAVTAVTVHIQAGGEVSATEHAMRRVPGTDTWYYVYRVPSQEGRIHYWFEAEDPAENVAREPSTPGYSLEVFAENPRREAIGAFVLLAAVLLVLLPVVYLLRRSRRRSEESPPEPEEPPKKT